MNKVLLVGRMVNDPQSPELASGNKVANFRIAVDRRNKSAQEADFFNVCAWGSTADYVMNYGSKGRSIAVDGRIQTRQYEANGEKKTVTEICAENLEFIGKRDVEQPGESAPKTPSAPTITAVSDEELPF